ncbi:MAG: organomercurial lyase [Nocardioidaceae bacterium]
MKLEILHMHDCPNVAALEVLLTELVGGRTDVEISLQLVEDDEQAAKLGMAGSPTLLINGADAFADPLDTPSFSCRLYRDDDGRLAGLPSVAQLRRALARADTLRGPSLPDSRVPRSPSVDLVRRAAFNALWEGSAPPLSTLAAATALEVSHARGVVAQLVAAGIATIEGDLAGDPLIVGADGVTVRNTPHRLVLRDRAVNTWCAFDAVGIPAALGDAVAQTACPTCGVALELVLRKGKPPGGSRVVGWWPQATEGPVNESFCPTASLFCSRAHLDTWLATANAPGEALPLTELADRGRVTWSLFANPQSAAGRKLS